MRQRELVTEPGVGVNVFHHQVLSFRVCQVRAPSLAIDDPTRAASFASTVVDWRTRRIHARREVVALTESTTLARSEFRLGIAWVMLWVALALHVTDEALTGFLSVYNPTVLALRARLGFWPMPTFEFREWLTGLIVAVLVLLALSPLVFKRVRWMRPVFYVFAVIMLLNGLGHTTRS